MTAIPATYFDGRQSRPYPVMLTMHDGVAIVRGDGVDCQAPIAALEVSPSLGRTHRIIRFPDGAFCEIVDLDAFDQLLSGLGISRSRVANWERNRRLIAASVIAFLAVVLLTYRYGIPAMARVVADRFPPAAVETLSRHVLEVLDRTAFSPSQVPAARQVSIRQQFARLRLPDGRPGQRYDVIFRGIEGMSANAMALPSGTIVVTDGLVEIARDDRELVAVLAHEAGHVDHRHGLRQVLQSSTVALFFAWYVGDVSSLAATAPTVLLQANYSREFERDADDYASRVLEQSGISPRHLADILERMELSDGRREHSNAPDFLSTHPSTAERLRRLRGQ
jgi:Zn-dependent protease with chaperone function